MALCELCELRKRKTRIEHGRTCLSCASRLASTLADLLRLADAARDWTPPPATGGAFGVFESKPPLSVQTLDPELETIVIDAGDPSSRVTILEILECHERAIRRARDLAPIGLVTSGGPMGTGFAFSRTVRFLGSQIAWVTLDGEFNLIAFSAHLQAAYHALAKYDPDREPRGFAVPCPTLADAGECGYLLRYTDASQPVTCKRCKVTRDVDQLVAVALADSTKPVWVDPEAASRHYGVTERELRRLASKGRIERNRGRYLLSSITREIYA